MRKRWRIVAANAMSGKTMYACNSIAIDHR